MNRKKFFLLIVLFTVLYIYMTSLDKIPEKIVLFQNENYEISHLKGTYIEGKATSIADRLWGSLTKVDSKDTGISKLKFFFFKQKTAYEIAICDWSSDVCSSDLP